MGDGIAHFGWRGQKSNKLKKFSTYGPRGTAHTGPRRAAPKDLKACRKDLEGRRQRTSRHGAIGPQGAAPLMSYWCTICIFLRKKALSAVAQCISKWLCFICHSVICHPIFCIICHLFFVSFATSILYHLPPHFCIICHTILKN